MNRVLLLAAGGAFALGCDRVTVLPSHLPNGMIVAEDPFLSVPDPASPARAPAASPPSIRTPGEARRVDAKPAK